MMKLLFKPFTKHLSFPLTFLFFIIFLSLDQNLFAQYERGRELFQPCKACHSIGQGDMIGPDLSGITERRETEWLYRHIKNSQELIDSGDTIAVRLYEKYNKVPMPPFDYTDEEIDILLAYIENYDEAAEARMMAAQEEQKEISEGKSDFFAETEDNSRYYRSSFIISVVLALIALFDLLVTKIIKARFIHLIVILISAFVGIEITIVEAQTLGRQPGYEPDQPILFSHKIHAGENQIDCKYCHFTVDESKHAGIPPVMLCMNCHNVIREGTHSGTAEIQKIYDALESGRPIEWIRVHNLQDHAYFSHAQHVNVGKIDCEECHGAVEEMHRIRQVNDLSMGWCIQCHRETEVQFFDNEFYGEYIQLHEEMKTGMKSRVTVDDIGGNECSKCHY